MNVLIVHHVLGGFGGAERYLRLLSEGLPGAGVEPHVLVFGAPGLAEAVRAEIGDALCTIGPPAPRMQDVWRGLRRHNAEVLHWNMPGPFMFGAGAMFLVPWGIPQVATDHLPGLQARRRDAVRRIANRRLGRLIVVSRSAADEARAHWPNCPDLDVVHNAAIAVGSAEGLTERGGEPRFGFVGRLTDQKAPEVAAEAFAEFVARFRVGHLVVVGEGPLRAELAGRLQHLGVRERVSFSGFVAPPLSPFTGIDVMLAPSRWEGFPLAPLEAMLAGVHVVASSIRPHEEMRELAPRLFRTVDGDVPSEWADAMKSALEAREGLGECGDLARRELAQALSLKDMARKTAASYRAALDG